LFAMSISWYLIDELPQLRTNIFIREYCLLLFNSFII